MQIGWWPQIDASVVVVDRLDDMSCRHETLPFHWSWDFWLQSFFGATSADGQRAMKPSGSTVTKFGGSALKKRLAMEHAYLSYH